MNYKGSLNTGAKEKQKYALFTGKKKRFENF